MYIYLVKYLIIEYFTPNPDLLCLGHTGNILVSGVYGCAYLNPNVKPLLWPRLWIS